MLLVAGELTMGPTAYKPQSGAPFQLAFSARPGDGERCKSGMLNIPI